MRVGIIGVGAMGSLLGFYLSAVRGHEVWLIGSWPEHIAAIQASGLVCERDGRRETRRINITARAEEAGPCAVVLMLVKAYQTAQAIVRTRALLQASTTIVTLQNGIGHYEQLAAAFGAERVIQGVTMLGATMLGPGEVRHAGQGSTFLETRNDRFGMLEELVDLFQAAGLPVEQRDDVESLIWNKLVINAGINALTALLRVRNGELAERPAARIFLEQLVREAADVAAARGTGIADDPLAQVLAVARATGANRSSMLQDVLRGNPTEIDAINGAVVREGERLGIATPYNRAVTLLIEAQYPSYQ